MIHVAKEAVCEAVIDGFESRTTLGGECGATGSTSAIAGFTAFVEPEIAEIELGAFTTPGRVAQWSTALGCKPSIPHGGSNPSTPTMRP